jgi:hypothetical protein
MAGSSSVSNTSVTQFVCLLTNISLLQGTNRAIELIKCFCGCSEVSRNDIERILMATIEANLRDEQARDLFKRSVKLDHPRMRPSGLKAMLCYELCAQVFEQGGAMDEDMYEEIKDLCPLHRLENELEDVYETDPDRLPEVLERIMVEMGLYLERTVDYRRFLDRLRDKLK